MRFTWEKQIVNLIIKHHPERLPRNATGSTKLGRWSKMVEGPCSKPEPPKKMAVHKGSLPENFFETPKKIHREMGESKPTRIIVDFLLAPVQSEKHYLNSITPRTRETMNNQAYTPLKLLCNYRYSVDIQGTLFCHGWFQRTCNRTGFKVCLWHFLTVLRSELFQNSTCLFYIDVFVCNLS